MTERLFDEDSYLKSFEATVVSCEAEKDGYALILDKTVFFPEEGGQSSDKGDINGVCVEKVTIKDDIITHHVKKAFEKGETVKGKIDWRHRFTNMQMHSGEHIFSGLVYKRFGLNNVGFHLSDNSATMDFDGKLSAQDIAGLEISVNGIIYENRRISTYYPDAETLRNTEYRSKKEIAGPVRLVEIENTDICACCAPHVRSTGEIGMFKIVSWENYKSGVRLNFLGGFRAFLDYSSKNEDLKAISTILSIKPGAELEGVEKVSNELKGTKSRLYASENLLIYSRVQSMKSSNEKPVIFLEKDQTANMKAAMEALHEAYDGTVAVFSGDEESGFKYYIESDSDDLHKISEKLKNEFGAKGGGRPGSIQGSINGVKKEKILTLFA